MKGRMKNRQEQLRTWQGIDPPASATFSFKEFQVYPLSRLESKAIRLGGLSSEGTSFLANIARGDVAGPVSQANMIWFCLESIDGRGKKMPLLVVMWCYTGSVSQARPTDLVLLQYCSGRRDQWAMRQDFQYLNIQRLVLHLLLLRHNHHYGL